jgi:type IV fimbrial biogenesis protein FimT
MLTITVLAVLVTIGVPAMQDLLARNRVKMAAQALADDLQWARGETIRRNRELYLTIDSDAWCYGVAEIQGCDCRLTDPSDGSACALRTADQPVLKTVSGAAFPGVRVTQTSFGGHPAWARFEPRRATARAGSLTFASDQGAELKVVLSLLGRVRLCSPQGSVPGYPPC